MMFVAMKPFGGQLLLLWLPKYYILKWAGADLIHGVHQCVMHHWKAAVFNILPKSVEL